MRSGHNMVPNLAISGDTQCYVDLNFSPEKSVSKLMIYFRV